MNAGCMGMGACGRMHLPGWAHLPESPLVQGVHRPTCCRSGRVQGGLKSPAARTLGSPRVIANIINAASQHPLSCSAVSNVGQEAAAPDGAVALQHFHNGVPRSPRVLITDCVAGETGRSHHLAPAVDEAPAEAGCTRNVDPAALQGVACMCCCMAA